MNRNTKINYKWLCRSFAILIMDVLIILFSYGIPLCLLFGFSNLPMNLVVGYLGSMPFWITSTIVTFYIMRLYHSIWSYASIPELKRIIIAFSILVPVYLTGTSFMNLKMPSIYFFTGFVLSFCLCSALRFCYRLVRSWIHSIKDGRYESGLQKEPKERIMIIGAGEAGRIIIREYKRNIDLNAEICCIIDDNKGKTGRYLEGVPIVGTRYDIVEKAEAYGIDRIIFAIPSISSKKKKDILHICKETGCKLQMLPGIYQLINGEVSIKQIRDVELGDLLGRDEICINNEEVLKLVDGLTVLITGGGGSIGSELCRQIAANKPGQLIIFDIYENGAYEIQQELKRNHPDLKIKVLIGSVRDKKRIRHIMEKFSPDIVFHAAAHKHVPLMEDSPLEAIKNNALGTFNLAEIAGECGVDKFVLISTDKAVNPTNIMGASKRICEMIIQMMNQDYPKTEFVAVRFGNVLGSNGSVIPVFKKQIAAGGPVTVTHPDIIRYFMTIPEAVALVLQAAHYAQGGEIFVLDMGEPVKIDDMARNLIRLSGLIPEKDIQIVYTGLRPGEKLFEEMLMAEEMLSGTDNRLIQIGKPIEFDETNLREMLVKMSQLQEVDEEQIRDMVKSVVDTYTPQV